MQYGLWSDYQHEKVECVPRQRTRIGGRQVNIALILDRELWTGEIEEGGNLGEVVVKGRQGCSQLSEIDVHYHPRIFPPSRCFMLGNGPRRSAGQVI